MGGECRARGKNGYSYRNADRGCSISKRNSHSLHSHGHVIYPHDHRNTNPNGHFHRYSHVFYPYLDAIKDPHAFTYAYAYPYRHTYCNPISKPSKHRNRQFHSLGCTSKP